MKTLVPAITLFLVFFSFNTSAQTDSTEFDGTVKIRSLQKAQKTNDKKNKWTAGFKAGINFGFPSSPIVKEAYNQNFDDRLNKLQVTNLNGIGDSYSFSNRRAFSGGLFLNYQLNNYLSIQPELLYVSLGYKERYTIEFIMDGSVNNETIYYESIRTYCFNGLQLPVLLKANLPLGKFSPYIFAGPALEFLLEGYVSDKLKSEIPNSENYNINEALAQNGFNTKKEFIKNEYDDVLNLAGITMGAGINKKFSERCVFNLEARYYISTHPDYAIQSSKHYNLGVAQAAFIIMTGLGFKLSK